MSKDATISIRISEELKEEALRTLSNIGIPMSLAIELFLRQVAETGKLPFAIGSGVAQKEAELEQAAREEDFWKAFTIWYFKAWPRFNSPAVEKAAMEELGFVGRSAGDVAHSYIIADTGGYSDRMTPEQRAAALDLGKMRSLLSDAKELVYWALDMDKTFVPKLTNAYFSETDKWCFRYIREQNRRALHGSDPIVEGVIGARHYGDDGLGEE